MTSFHVKSKHTESATVLGFQLTARTPGEVDSVVDIGLPVRECILEAGARRIQGGYDAATGYWQFTFNLTEFSPGAFMRRLVDAWCRDQPHMSLNVQLHMAWNDMSDAGTIRRGLLLDQIDLSYPFFVPV